MSQTDAINYAFTLALVLVGAAVFTLLSLASLTCEVRKLRRDVMWTLRSLKHLHELRQEDE